MDRRGNRALREALPPAVAQVLVRSDPLWQKTSLRVGGPARFLAEPTDPSSVRALLEWAKRERIPTVLLGGGTNVIFPDAGYDGLVLSTLGLRGRAVRETEVRVGAGERLAAIAWWTARLGLTGLEWACGIPGSVGGAVAMNAGSLGGEIAGVLASAEVLADGEVARLSTEALRLGYRTSALLTGELDGVLLESTFALRRDDPIACLERARAGIAERAAKLPVGASAGCIFRNPPEGPTAGQLLDRAGCKGLRVGSAVVSPRHANVIVNEGMENAADVLQLIDEMRRRVLGTFGVELREEVVVYPRAISR